MQALAGLEAIIQEQLSSLPSVHLIDTNDLNDLKDSSLIPMI